MAVSQAFIFHLKYIAFRRIPASRMGFLVKILNGMDNLDREHFFVYSRWTLRGHNVKLFKPRCRLDLMKFTLHGTVLPQDFIDICTVITYK